MPLRFLLLCATLLSAGAAAAENLTQHHERLLAAQLAKIEQSSAGAPALYLLAAGMSNQQDVFRNDAQTLRDLFDRHWNTANRSVALIADDSTKETAAFPTRSNLARAAKGLGARMNPQQDVLLVFLSSHGTSSGLEATLPGDLRFAYTAVDVRRLLEASGARYRIVILSACHAGALMNELADENTLVMAAAHASRTSFGCSFTHLHTWFTQALFEALAATPRFEQAFRAAAARIEERELGGEAFEHSMPQIHVGNAIRARLATIERRATRAADWEPPVLGTQAGRVRQLLGDYLATRAVKGGDTEVRWLQLRSIGAPREGNYPVVAWAQHFHRNSGKFEASYDPRTRVLSGGSDSVGTFRLSRDGQRFVGVAHKAADAVPPAEIAFEKVLRREVFEASASHAPTKLRANPASVIRLLYLGAEDCAHCRAWERDHLQDGRLGRMPEFKHIEFVTAKRKSLKSRLRKDELPGNLAHLYERFDADESARSLLAIVPAFVLMVDDRVRAWRTGAFLDSPVYPALRAAVREKTGVDK